MFDTLEAKIRKRVQRRYAELQLDPDAFIRRFDLNGDGILDENEKHAALSTLAHELLREDTLVSSMNESELLVGSFLRERYKILSKIGDGAQGIAYSARDKTNNEIVVVKQLRLSHMDAWEAYDLFCREAAVIAVLSHPRLPKFIETFELKANSKTSYFSVQSLLPGVSLADKLASGVFFCEKVLVSIATQCLEILEYLHTHQPAVLHRDIKPSNLLQDDDGVVYLVDFGAVQYATSTKTMAVGTPGYMASEQLIGNAQPQSDLYSLGATLIRLATRHHPHELELNRMRLDWRDRASLSDSFSDWIDKLIDPEFEDRFKSAKVANSFLDSKQKVVVEREFQAKPRESLKLTELLDEKPEGTSVRLWESVDQFVCTFPPTPIAPIKDSNQWGSLVNRLFDAASKKRLFREGGGFGFDATGTCYVTAGNNRIFNGPIANLRIQTYDPLELHGSETWIWGIEGKYKFSAGSAVLEESQILALGLNYEDITWIWKRLSLFFEAHQLEVMDQD